MPLGFLVAKAKRGNSHLHDCLRPATKPLCSTTFTVTFSPFSTSHAVSRRWSTKEGPPYKSTRHHLPVSPFPAISKSHPHHNQGALSEPTVPKGGGGMTICPEANHGHPYEIYMGLLFTQKSYS